MVALAAHAHAAGAAARSLPAGPDLGPWFVALYGSWLDGRPDRVAAAVTAVLDGPGPVLVHCAAGRDRTGVVVATLLRAAGVRRDAVVADYRRTEPNQPRIAERLAADGLPPDVRGRIAGLRTPEAIEHVLDVLEGHPRGAAGWLRDRGVPAAQLAGWTVRLVDDDPSTTQ